MPISHSRISTGTSVAASTWMLRLCRVAMAVEGGVAKGRGWASSVTSVCIARGSSSN
ncbi:hypothetical protein D3C71_1818870 [compost metagenome]